MSISPYSTLQSIFVLHQCALRIQMPWMGMDDPTVRPYIFKFEGNYPEKEYDFRH